MLYRDESSRAAGYLHGLFSQNFLLLFLLFFYSLSVVYQSSAGQIVSATTPGRRERPRSAHTTPPLHFSLSRRLPSCPENNATCLLQAQHSYHRGGTHTQGQQQPTQKDHTCYKRREANHCRHGYKQCYITFRAAYITACWNSVEFEKATRGRLKDKEEEKQDKEGEEEDEEKKRNQAQ